ncbi:MAG: hypothetical protein ACTSW1_18195 [Candidatus Hodarchaeales archaeon]
MKESSKLRVAYSIELDSFLDLVILISSSNPERPSTILKWVVNNSHFYGSFATFPGYYEYQALPVLFYVKLDKPMEHDYENLVKYDLQAEKDQIALLSHLEEKDLENIHTGLIRFIPIVKLRHAPDIFSTD